MADIFISYASADRKRIRPLVEVLEREGWSVWWDRSLVPGDRFEETIEDELDSARCVLVAWSADSVRSRWCRSEASEGFERGILVPLLLDQVRLPLSFRGTQAASMTDWPESPGELDAVLAAVRRHVDARDFAASPPTLTVPPSPGHDGPSIAVLPFANLSNDPEQEYFSDGIAEDILNQLAMNSSLVVRPKSSAFALKGSNADLRTIARQLKVTYVLEGSVRRSGERVRVTVQLSDVGADRSIWSDRYDREMTDVFAVQDEITRSIVDALNARFVRQAKPRQFVNNEAYQALLLGRHHLSRFELADAAHWLKIATELNPSNADAWAHLAESNMFATYGGAIPNSGTPSRDRARWIENALTLQPDHPNALGMRAFFAFLEDRDYQAAIDALSQLVEANPNSTQVLFDLGVVLNALRRYDVNEKLCPRVVELDPLSPLSMAGHVVALLYSGAVGRARGYLERYKSTLKTEAAKQSLAYLDFELALTQRDAPAMRSALAHISPAVNMYSAYGAAAAHFDGNEDEVREISQSLASAGRYRSHWLQSRMAMIQGDHGSALFHCREGILKAEPHAVLLSSGSSPWERAFPEFHALPSYQQLLADFGLDAATRARVRIPALPF